jgi:hypothetical protein
MTTMTQVRGLARLLRNVEPETFGLLKCDGVIEVPNEQGIHFGFILGIPKGLHTPRPLRTLLLEERNYSLTKRVQLAQQLARSVMFVHAAGFVHKDIRPGTVLVFDPVLFSTRNFQVPVHLSWLDSRDSARGSPNRLFRRFRVGKEPLPSPCKTGSLV